MLLHEVGEKLMKLKIQTRYKNSVKCNAAKKANVLDISRQILPTEQIAWVERTTQLNTRFKKLLTCVKNLALVGHSALEPRSNPTSVREKGVVMTIS